MVLLKFNKILVAFLAFLLLLNIFGCYTKMNIPTESTITIMTPTEPFEIVNQGNQVDNMKECNSVGDIVVQKLIGESRNGGVITGANYIFDGIECEGEICLCW